MTVRTEQRPPAGRSARTAAGLLAARGLVVVEGLTAGQVAAGDGDRHLQADVAGLLEGEGHVDVLADAHRVLEPDQGDRRAVAVADEQRLAGRDGEVDGTAASAGGRGGRGARVDDLDAAEVVALDGHQRVVGAGRAGDGGEQSRVRTGGVDAPGGIRQLDGAEAQVADVCLVAEVLLLGRRLRDLTGAAGAHRQRGEQQDTHRSSARCAVHSVDLQETCRSPRALVTRVALSVTVTRGSPLGGAGDGSGVDGGAPQVTAAPPASSRTTSSTVSSSTAGKASRRAREFPASAATTTAGAASTQAAQPSTLGGPGGPSTSSSDAAPNST